MATISDERLAQLQGFAARSARAYHAKSEQGKEHADMAAAIAEIQYLRSQAGASEAVAWEGYWPGAGSINSVTRLTSYRPTMEKWKADDAEITPLYARPAPIEITEEMLQRIATLYGNFIPGHGWTGFGPTPDQISAALQGETK